MRRSAVSLSIFFFLEGSLPKSASLTVTRPFAATAACMRAISFSAFHFLCAITVMAIVTTPCHL